MFAFDAKPEGGREDIGERPPPRGVTGETLPLRVLAQLNGLAPEDVRVECVMGRIGSGGEFEAQQTLALAPAGQQGGAWQFSLDLQPLPGLQQFRLRLRPQHAALSHAFELGFQVGS